MGEGAGMRRDSNPPLHGKSAMMNKMVVSMRLQGKRVTVLRHQPEVIDVPAVDEEDFLDPIPFWPIDLVPEDDDRVIEQALIEERWARLDALAGRVG